MNENLILKHSAPVQLVLEVPPVVIKVKDVRISILIYLAEGLLQCPHHLQECLEHDRFSRNTSWINE